VTGLLYFVLIGRHRLILSPEEQFAMTQGRVSHDAGAPASVLSSKAHGGSAANTP
jgi:hypothetical protein